MTPARPRQTTIAGWLVIAGSVFTILTIAQQLQSLGLMTTTDSIERLISRRPFDSLDLTVDQVESTMRVLGMIAGACAAATAILGWQVLRERSATARLWLSILVGPLFLAGFGSGGLASTLVLAAVVMLWMQPSRDWFAGTWKPTPAGPAAPTVEKPPVQRREVTSAGTSAGERPVAAPVPGWPPAYDASRPTATSPVPDGRPSALLGAVILTWVFSILAAAAFVIAAIVLIADPARIIDELERTNPDLMAQQGVTEDLIQVVFLCMAVVVVVWSISACVLAFLLLRRVAWARIVLMVCAGCSGLVLIVAALANPLMIAPLFASGATIGLLARRDVTLWLKR